MNRGYIRLWRKSLDNNWLRNHTLWAFWCWCLLKATYRPVDIMVGYQRVHLEPGQLIFGRNRAATEIGASPRQVRTCVAALKNNGNICIQTTNKFSIISIVNWNSYQGAEKANDQQHVPPATSQRPATDHKQELINKEKEIKEKKAAPPSAAGIELSQHLLDLILSNHPGFKRPSLETWAKHADRMLSTDGRTPEEIKSVMEWAQHDQFWHRNVLSMGTLREKFDRLFLEMGAKNGNHNQGYRRHEKTSAGNASTAGSGENFSAKYDHLGRTLSVDE